MGTWQPPRSDDFDIWLEAIEGEFKADLVVALACAAVSDEAVDELAGGRCDEEDKTHSQPSRSAVAIIPRAMTGLAKDVPRR